MNLKLVSNENMGGALLLLLIILVSQSSLFNMLLSSTLGKAIILVSLGVIGYMHRMLGVVGAMVVIVMISTLQSDNYYLEGFEEDSKMEEKEDEKNKMQSLKLNDAAPVQVESSKMEDNVTTEGFDILGTENVLKRGKQSNTIPVDMMPSDEVMPNESSLGFGEGFAVL